MEVLTPLFLEDLNRIAEKQTVVLLLDTYEQTGGFLDDWLRSLLDDRYGDLHPNFLLGIAGREPLNRNDWSSLEGWILRSELEPFTIEETRLYLSAQGINSEAVLQEIWRLSSGGLPLLVGMMAQAAPTSANAVLDRCEDAVERFLKWESDAAKRQIAMNAALPRVLNQDVLAVLVTEGEVDTLFAWLKDRSFVVEHPAGWQYHPIVREQILRYQLRLSPQNWARLHEQLAVYYDGLRQRLELAAAEQWKNETWQKYTLAWLYHVLCAAPEARIGVALNGWLAALKGSRKLLFVWAEVMVTVAAIVNCSELKQWGERLRDGLKEYNENRYEVLIQVLSDLLEKMPQVSKTVMPDKCHSVSVEAVSTSTGSTKQRLGKQRDRLQLEWNTRNEKLRQLTQALAHETVITIKFQLEEQVQSEETHLKHLEEMLTQIEQTLTSSKTFSTFQISTPLEEQWYATALSWRGHLYTVSNRYKESLADLNQAIELDDNNQWAIAHRGVTLRRMKQYEESLADFNRAIELDAKEQWIVAQRGVTLRMLEQYEESLADFNRAIELDAKEQWIVAQRGVTLRMLERYEEALADFNRAIELDGDRHWIVANRGVTLRMLKRYEEALADLNRAIELDENYSWAIANRGEVYRLLKRYEEALADFDRAIELDENYDWAIASRGQVYQSLERYEEALADFNRAIELDETNQWAIANRGVTYRNMERYEEALADFNRAIELDSNDDWMIAQRGETYKQMERYEEALADFNRAIELDENYSWAIESRGTTYGQMERYEEALVDFNRAIELDAKYQRAIACRGIVYRMRQRYEESLTELNRAIELDRNDGWATANRGETYRKMERYEEALVDLNQAIELDPQDDWFHYARHLVYVNLHQFDAAQADLESAIEIAQPEYEQTPTDWQNTFNLALYHLAANHTATAETLHLQALNQGATTWSIRAAILDLKEFLVVFPSHLQAQQILQTLQSAIAQAHTNLD